MSYMERSAWIMLMLPIFVYSIYLFQILSRAQGRPLDEVQYASTMLWATAAFVVLAIVVHIVVFVFFREGVGEEDQRDQEIGRFGEYIGHFVIATAGVAALALSIFEADHFWIANTIYLAFMISTVVGSGAKIHAYRRGHAPW